MLLWSTPATASLSRSVHRIDCPSAPTASHCRIVTAAAVLFSVLYLFLPRSSYFQSYQTRATQAAMVDLERKEERKRRWYGERRVIKCDVQQCDVRISLLHWRRLVFELGTINKSTAQSTIPTLSLLLGAALPARLSAAIGLSFRLLSRSWLCWRSQHNQHTVASRHRSIPCCTWLLLVPIRLVLLLVHSLPCYVCALPPSPAVIDFRTAASTAPVSCMVCLCAI